MQPLNDHQLAALLGDTEALDRYLRLRLLELTQEKSQVAIKAVELLLTMDLSSAVDNALSALSISDLELFRAKAVQHILSQSGANGGTSDE